jgi:hypothetical protein
MSDKHNIRFAGNSAIDAAIKEMLPSFDAASRRRIRRAILNAKAAAEKHDDERTDAGARHVFRELIPAARLNAKGFNLEYERLIDGKTPDWVDFGVGLMMECYTYERGGSAPFHDRVNAAVAAKCAKYGALARERRLHFVVAVYIDFLTCISLEECLEDTDRFRAAFNGCDALSALLFFTETQVVRNRQEYGFVSLSKDGALRDLSNWPFHTQTLKPKHAV